jgi:hypothetical protein
MTADSAHVAAVARALLNTVCSCENREDEFAFLGCAHCDATIAVETLTPLIRAQVLADLMRHEGWHKDDWGVDCIYRDAATRAIEGTP